VGSTISACSTPRLRVAIDLAVSLGQRRADLLNITRDHLRADAIYGKQGKTGAELLVYRRYKS
jgi:integrase